MSRIMKGITICSECAYYNMKKHCCNRGAHIESNPKDPFYDDCPLPTIEPTHWIPVTERLPEDVYGKDREQIVVLVCTKSGKVSQCARMADYDCIADKTLTKVEWIKNGKFYWSKNKAVTHWMPLPTPPKENEP